MIELLFWGLFVPLFLTIVVEGLLAWLFLKDKHDIIKVILVQCMTNPALNLIIYINRVYGGIDEVLLTVLLEIVVVIVEAVIYQKQFSYKNAKKAWWFSIVANAVSVGLGLLLFWAMGLLNN